MAKRPKAYRRPIYETVLARAHEERRFIQVLAGPRQVGKTTLARQVMDAVGVPAHIASADDPALRDRAWLETQWQIGRQQARNGGRAGGLLVIDEIQKVPAWSEITKRLWDEDTAAGLPLRVMLLGSAPLLVQRGLTESLAGRFELIRVGHWSFAEMRDAFGFDLDRYLVFGGYPGAAALIGDPDRWTAYVLDSLVETSLARDILLLTRVDKPMLLRQLFRLACERSGDILPYSRMLDRLEGAGNTTTLAGYLLLLAGAGLATGLPKHDDAPRRRASSPKLLALNTALLTAVNGWDPLAALEDAGSRGRLIETAIGAHLLNAGQHLSVGYWREGSREVDFVVRRSGGSATGEPSTLALGVASGRERESRSGLAEFGSRAPGARSLVVGNDGVAVEEFLATDPADWLGPATG
jgi:predicted AAA+ superfamily ATPase